MFEDWGMVAFSRVPLHLFFESLKKRFLSHQQPKTQTSPLLTFNDTTIGFFPIYPTPPFLMVQTNKQRTLTCSE